MIAHYPKTAEKELVHHSIEVVRREPDLPKLTHGWDAEEIHREHPHLSFSQIHAALGYYYDNKAECDELILERSQRTHQIRKETQNLALQLRLQGLSQK